MNQHESDSNEPSIPGGLDRSSDGYGPQKKTLLVTLIQWTSLTLLFLTVLGIIVGFLGWGVSYIVEENIEEVNEHIGQVETRLEDQINMVGRDLDGRIDGIAERLSRVEGLLTNISDSLNRQTIAAAEPETEPTIVGD